ncbi:MAG: DUF1848 family protein [bacterium]|jgi:hypothetical protein|nr:DUF1848 family protein [bacterium]
MHLLSASRRMDLPAFQLEAFLGHARRGWMTVPHPFTGRPQRIRLVGPEVAGIVFWTRRPAALLPHLDELRRLWRDALRVHVTLTGMPRELEPRAPAVAEVLPALASLAQGLGPRHLSWRFDPLLLSEGTPAEWWVERFEALAPRLAGHVSEVMLSWLDLYARTRRNLLPVEGRGFRLHNPTPAARRDLLDALAGVARRHGLTLKACCEPDMLEHSQVLPGACLDGAWFEQRRGLVAGALGAAPSRAGCGCCRSRDVGVYDSCAFGCRYCYANRRPHETAPADPWTPHAPGDTLPLAPEW